MKETWEFLKTLTDPESILSYGGLWLLLFVIFAETGLLVGFFLPGDSLVFISGLCCATKGEYLRNIDFSILILCMSSAAIAGNMTGYWFGKKAGEKLFTKNDNLIFKKRYVEMTRAFYSRHGRKTLILGRFLPIIRTFAPILAGVIQVEMKKFLLYNVVGAVLWIGSIGGIGFFLGKKFPWVEDYLGYIVIGLIVITTIPVVVTYLKEKKSSGNFS